MAEPNYELLADAIYRQEGGSKAKKPYGVLSVPVKNKADARQIVLNTARNNYQRWEQAGRPGAYLDFLADRYVPSSADPQGNVNWKSNVAKIYAQLSEKPKVAAAKPDVAMAPVLDPLLLRRLPPVNYPMFPQYPLVRQ